MASRYGQYPGIRLWSTIVDAGLFHAESVQRHMNGTFMQNIGNFKERLSQLEKWQDEVGDRSASASAFKAIMQIAERGALLHGAYHHYTNIASFAKIFKSKNAHSLRLTPISAVRLNDRNECDKYADANEAQRTFIACFNHENSESANLWWLYAHGDPESVRITFSQKDFVAWSGHLANSGVCMADVVYAAVNGANDLYPQKRRNVLSWEDQRIRIDGLKALLCGAKAGRLKDYEWRSEAETRIIKVGSSDAKYEFVEIPEEIIASLRITTSPWATEKIRQKICAIADSHLGRFGWKASKTTFRPSVLTGTMDYLKRFVRPSGGCRKGVDKKEQ